MFESSWPETLAHRIHDISHEVPDAVAVKDTQGNHLSYSQLMDRINHIASILLDANVAPRSIIVVYQEPSIDWICSLLAVMRVGAIYVPFDINIPLARLEIMLETCQPSVMLVHGATAADAKQFQAKEQMLVKDVSTLSEMRTRTTPIIPKASDPIAILHTSGSTGIPKGVILSHSSLRNQVEGVARVYHFGAETVLQQTAISFDLSLDQVMTALCNGGTLVIAQRSIRGDSVALTKVIAEEQITFTSATPSEYLSWLQYGSDNLAQSQSWTSALSVGEQYPWKLFEALRGLERSLGHTLRLFNVYGPTEVTVSSNRIELSPELPPQQRIAAGYTLPNYSIYIFDDILKPVPVGMPGEVLVGGSGVTIGYLHGDDGKFISDPFATPYARSQGWTRAYRTGDRGVLREDGALEILGRIAGDSQIKLRGIRIEMEDVENTILRAAKGTISEVAVTPRGDPPILIAHAVLASNVKERDRNEFLQAHVSNLPLPQYMRPAAIFPVTSMPLNPHGKIDRLALAQLLVEKPVGETAKAGKLTSTESQIRDIWEALLPRELTQLHPLNSNSDFFLVGGNSMLLIKLQRSILETFNVNLPVIRLFENSTLAAMAAAVENTSDNGPVAIDWEHETAVSRDIIQLGTLNSHHTSPRTPPQVVVLTGATGFLGKEILRQLTNSANIQQVHCIAVRDENKLADFYPSSKVVVHKGDLRHPQCGLSNDNAQTVFNTADAVIHNGADVSFLKSYASLRPANVSSTKALYKLSLPRRIPFHYVSSVATGRITDNTSFGEVSLLPHPPPPGFKDHYAATKWASEVFLEKATTLTRLPVWIHRPSSITGEGVSELDVMHNLLTFSVLTGAVPAASNRWKGTLDFISVEKAARGILRDVNLNPNLPASTTPQPSADAGNSITFRHQASETVIPMNEMAAHLGRETGKGFEVVGLREWIERAREHGLNRLVAEYLEAVEMMGEKEEGVVVVVFQKLRRGGGLEEEEEGEQEEEGGQEREGEEGGCKYGRD